MFHHTTSLLFFSNNLLLPHAVFFAKVATSFLLTFNFVGLQGPKRQQKPYSCACLFLKYKKAKRRKRRNKCLQKSFLTGVHSVEWPPAHVQGTIWWGVHSVEWPPAHVQATIWWGEWLRGYFSQSSLQSDFCVDEAWGCDFLQRLAYWGQCLPVIYLCS